MSEANLDLESHVLEILKRGKYGKSYKNLAFLLTSIIIFFSESNKYRAPISFIIIFFLLFTTNLFTKIKLIIKPLYLHRYRQTALLDFSLFHTK